MRSSLRVIGGGDCAYRKEAPLGANLELPEAPGLGEVRLLVVRLVGERPEALSEVICLSRRRHAVPRYERSLTWSCWATGHCEAYVCRINVNVSRVAETSLQAKAAPR